MVQKCSLPRIALPSKRNVDGCMSCLEMSICFSYFIQPSLSSALSSSSSSGDAVAWPSPWDLLARARRVSWEAQRRTTALFIGCSHTAVQRQTVAKNQAAYLLMLLEQVIQVMAPLVVKIKIFALCLTFGAHHFGNGCPVSAMLNEP